jgi:8-oxo-dGTP diphosphatase
MADYIDKLAFIELVDGKILSTMSKGKDTWYIPGGKREGDETDEQALIREVKEELNVDILPETIERYGTFEAQAHDKSEGIIVRMTCYMARYDGRPEASSEIERIAYLSYADKENTSAVDQLIFDDLYQKGLLV